MSAMETKEWKREVERLDATLSLIRHQLDKWEDVLANRKVDIIEARKQFGEIAYDPNELVESIEDFRLYSRELDRQELVYSHAFDARRKLLLLLDAPYFGRIDFLEQGTSEAEPIYIGKSTVLDANEDRVIVYDWRTPIASMFYDYQLGEAEYEPPAGVIRGTIELKRQFLIFQGQLKHMFDTGLHIADRLLQLMLGQNADDKMKSIVTTIQREQNQIIRDTLHRVVVVQGAAGSGKTSAAMQRAAYMLYSHRDTWKANDILLLSPNSLFSDYVSGVLPELGEDNLRQMTFQQLLEEALGPDHPVEDPFIQLESLLAAPDGDAYTEARSRAIRWKATLACVEQLDAYIASLETEGMRFNPIGFRNRTVVSVEQLQKLWYENYAGLTVRKRVENIKLWVADELKAKHPYYVQVVYKNLVKQNNYLGTDEELQEMAKKRVGAHFKRMKAAVEGLAFIDYRGLYEQWFEKMEAKGELEEIRRQTLEGLRGELLPYEEAIPLMYLRQAFVGVEQHHSIRHLMIDEAQDYSPFQLHMIRKIYPRGGMTLLGDFQQAILAHTSVSGNSLQELQGLFPAESTRVFELTKSYRSTREIVDLTMSVIRRTDIEPFSRDGDRPLVVRVAARDRLPAAAAEAVRRQQAAGASSIAVICKTAHEAEEAHAALRLLLAGAQPGDATGGEDGGGSPAAEGLALELEPGLELRVKPEAGPNAAPAGTAVGVDTRPEAKAEAEAGPALELINKYTQTFKRGIVVIPSYLAKGLEFDGVVVYDASAAAYAQERERRLFYTVCTRALHHLTLLVPGELTPFLPDPTVYDLADGDGVEPLV
ncbi:RNA polymerase recycling motor HelD [Paenibacillus sp. HJGM_3]|uniref:RNA polymerase recycling motor HelD n=1 Tax=Paenibacillus sp. HJGM_3 TaxID=3379816 RepID=UPI00385D756A